MAPSGVPADISRVEQELQHLWRNEAEKSSAGPVLCSRTLNLIVYCSALADLRSAAELLDPIITQHPCRAILISLAASDAERDIHSEVSASCLTSHDGNRYIGRELISIAAKPAAQQRLASIVRALILPDLPVFLWWREARSLGGELFRQLSELAARIILDSDGLQDLRTDWPRVHSLVGYPNAAVSDLAWSRLTPWRQLIAQLFDGPARAPYLSQVSKIVVEYGGHIDREGVPADALLLAAWLARQLGFRNPEPLACEDVPSRRPSIAWELRGGNSRLYLELRHGKQAAKGVTAVFLSCHQAEPASFVVSRTQEGKGLATRSELAGQPPLRRLVRTVDESSSRLVSSELEIPGRDMLYEEVLNMASGLAPALSPV